MNSWTISRIANEGFRKKRLKNLTQPRLWRDFAFEAPAHTLHAMRSLIRDKKAIFPDIKVEIPTKFDWEFTHKWVATIFDGFASIASVEPASIPQVHKSVVLIRISIGKLREYVVIDYSDYPDYIEEEALKKSVKYFKMQYLKEGYAHPKILPGQFIPDGLDLYSYIPLLRPNNGKKFKCDVYGRFGKSFAHKTRSKAVDILSNQRRFSYRGGLDTVRYSRYLREITSSRICIDLPGNGPFCFRLIEYLALGACVIGVPHKAAFWPPLQDGVHIKFCRPDLSDIVDLCEYYLHNEDQRRRMGIEAKRFFDSVLHKDRVAEYYLQKVKEAIGM